MSTEGPRPVGSSDRVQCAAFRAAHGPEVAGTAPTSHGFLFIELPLPWSHAPVAEPRFADLGAIAADHGVSLHAVVPEPSGGADAGSVEVISYTLRDDRTGFDRRAWHCPPEAVVEVCRAAITGAPLPGLDAPRFEGRELFLCTHGRRDTCCGSLGTAVHLEAAARLAGRNDVRLRRSSHLGGHRFAPTAVTFPDGYAWARLDATTVEDLLDAGRFAALLDDPTRVVAHCRGWCALPSGPEQVAEARVLAEAGSTWPTQLRRTEVHSFDRTTLRTVVDVTSPSATRRVGVSVRAWIPQPTCGAIDAPEFRVEPLWVTDAPAEPGTDPVTVG